MILRRGVIVWAVVGIVIGYQIKMYSPETDEKVQLRCQGMDDNRPCRRQFFIFPYQVYSYEVMDQNKTHTGFEKKHDYVFVKMDQQQLEQTLMLNSSLEEQNELSFLYQKLPSNIHFLSQLEEYLELKPLSCRPDNTHFMVRNWSRPSKPQQHNMFQITVLSLDINRCLSEIVHRVMQELVQAEITIEEWIEGKNDQPNTPSSRILEATLNSTAIDNITCHPYQIFGKVFTESIPQRNKWEVLHDGFQASLLQLNLSQDVFSMTYSRYRSGRRELKQRFTQPYGQVSLKNITFSGLCTAGSHTRVLIGDQHSYLVFQVTYKDWYAREHRTSEQKFIGMFFGEDCQVIVVQSDGIRKGLDPQSQLIEFNGTINGVQSLWGQDFTIRSDLNWQIYKGNLQEISRGMSVHNFQQTAPSSYFIENQLILDWYEMEEQLEASIIPSSQNLFYHQTIDTLIQNQNQTTSIFQQSIFSLPSLLNSTTFKAKTMSRIVFEHIRESYRDRSQRMQLPATFVEFQETLQEEGECWERTADGSLLIVSLKEGNWRWCSFTIHPQSYYLASFALQSPVNYRMFVCGARDNLEPSYPTVKCNLLIQNSPQNTQQQLRISLYSNHQYRFFVLKNPNPHAKATTTFYFRDIDREQLQFASTVFFVIMVILTTTLFVLICIVLLRPAFRAFFIYHGWIQDYPQPSYPLSWFNFKIKTKQLQDAGIIAYVRHNLVDQTDHMVCCFCLQHLEIDHTVAQTYCQHEFHLQCFHDWLRNEPNLRCPTCRREFNRAALAHFHNDL